MGPSHARDQRLAPDDVKTLLRAKDGRIATLETRLEAYSARASTSHTRLLKTIDVLDALRSQHALEISAEEQEKMKLIHDVDRWRSMARNLEVEKDELKDAVEDLIEKVGCISLNMQEGNLNIEFPEQVPADTTNSGGKDDYRDSLLAYATSIITRLRTEVDLERQRHNTTVEEANLRIDELEAKVAVREAELERFITSYEGQEHQPEEPGEKRIPGKRISEPTPISDEECLCFLESNNARNRSLEVEIHHIAEKLEHAKMAASTSSGSRKGSHSPTPPNGCQTISTPSPRARSVSIDPNVLSRPWDDGRIISAPVLSSPSTVSTIVQLDSQIRTMTAHMDALVSERATLIEAAARQRRVTDGLNMNTFRDILRVEGECVRLQAEADDLREQLQHTRTCARNREKALLREIVQLRASTSGLSALHPALDLRRVFSPRPFEDDIASEESMELASPLVPTIVPNSNPPSFRDAEIELNLASFPYSPEHVSLPGDALPFPWASRGSPGPQGIERVQAALDAARMHLTQKEGPTQLSTEKVKLEPDTRTQTRSGGSDGGG